MEDVTYYDLAYHSEDTEMDAYTLALYLRSQVAGLAALVDSADRNKTLPACLSCLPTNVRDIEGSAKRLSEKVRDGIVGGAITQGHVLCAIGDLPDGPYGEYDDCICDDPDDYIVE